MLQPRILQLTLLGLCSSVASEVTADEANTETTEELVSIAQHIRQDPRILHEFRPPVLRALVSDPDSLHLLPMSVLNDLMSDPIFKVSLPADMREKISELMESLLDRAAAIVEDFSQDDGDYSDYYDLIDYGSGGEIAAVSDFLSDLDPEFLKTISPDLIVAYFESASPEDIKNILNSSSILINLPADTISELLQKLPQDLLISVVNSRGVEELFNSTAQNLTTAEMESVNRLQISVASKLVTRLNLEVVSALPEFLVRSNLGNTEALVALLHEPSKLEALAKKYPNLLAEIPGSVVAQVLEQQPRLVVNIPQTIFSDLLTCPLVMELAGRQMQTNLTTLVAALSHQLATALASKSQLLDCTPVKLLVVLAGNLELVARLSPELLVRAVNRLPPSQLQQLLTNNQLLAQLSGQSVQLLLQQEKVLAVLESLPDTMISRLATNRDLLLGLSARSLLAVAARVPRVLGRVPDKILLELVGNEDILEHINGDFVDSLTPHQVELLLSNGQVDTEDILLRLPLSTILSFALDSQLLPLIPDSALLALVTKHSSLLDLLPAQALAEVAKKRPWLVGMFPHTLTSQLAQRTDVLDLLSDKNLTNLLTFQPSLLTLLNNLPTPSLLHLLDTRPGLLDLLPPVAEPYLAQLATQEEFIRKLPTSLLVNLATKPVILRNVNKYSLIKVLQVHPGLPVSLPFSDLEMFIHYLEDSWFRLRLPCETVVLMVNRIDLNQLPASILEAVVTSNHILSCVPAKDLEELMGERLGLSRLPLMSLVSGARRLPVEKYSFTLVSNFMSNQAPDIISANMGKK